MSKFNRNGYRKECEPLVEGTQENPGDTTSIFEYKQELFGLCKDKAQEFAFLGYEHVSADDIFHCAMMMVRKNERLHELVSVILTLQVGQFMNFETMNAFKGVLSQGNV